MEKWNRSFCLASAIVLGAGSGAFADPKPGEDIWYFQNGSMLLKNCDAYLRLIKGLASKTPQGEKAEFYFDAGRCKGTIESTSDTLALQKDSLRGGILPIACVPDHVRISTLVKFVVDYGHMHPELGATNAQNFIRYALAEKYPCSVKNSPQPSTGICDAEEENCG
ncbi:Rap1a/Tai family immunity protein [Mesorhizobium sp. BHbsci]